MGHKIGQLTLTSGQKSNTTSDIFIAQPDSQKEELAGKLFILIEIESKSKDDQDIINFIINGLSHNYYQNEKIILRERVSTLKVEHIFESALIKTNKSLIEYIKNEKIDIKPELINATIGVIYEDEIHFTSIGKNKIWLIYRNKKDNEYKLTDILERTKAGEEKHEITLPKLFPSVVSGSIPSEGYIVVTNEALPEYFSNKQFLDIITTLPPAGAVEQMKNILGTINSYVSFLGIIIKNTVLPPRSSYAENIPVPQTAAINAIRQTEAETEKIMSPSGLVNVKKIASGYLSALQKTFSFLTPKGQVIADSKTIIIKDKIFFNRKSYKDSLLKTKNILKDIGIYAVNIFIYIAKYLSNWRRVAALLKRITINFYTGFKKSFLWIKNLRRPYQIIFAVIFVCLIAFAANLMLSKKKNIVSENNKKFVELAQIIEKKQNDVDSSILYKDDTRAKALFAEIETLMKELPQENDQQKNQTDIFNKKFQEQLSKINKSQIIEFPTVIIDLSEAVKSLNPSELSISGQKIVILDNNTKNIYTYDIADKKSEAIPIDSKIIGSLSMQTNGEGNDLYYFKNDELVKFDSAGKTFSTSIFDPYDPNREIIGMSIYNKKLYLADKKNEQVYRYDRITDKLAAGAIWLKEKVALSKVADMAIDGKIYLLEPTGVIVLANNKKEEADFESPIPPLEDATKIIAAQDLDHIFILEPKNKRILTYDKKGRLITQITSAQFDDLRDAGLHEKDKKLYVLNGTKILEVGINF